MCRKRFIQEMYLRRLKELKDMNDKLDLTIGIVSYHNVSDITTAVDSIELYTEPSIKKLVYIIDNADNEADYQMLVQKYPRIECRPVFLGSIKEYSQSFL